MCAQRTSENAKKERLEGKLTERLTPFVIIYRRHSTRRRALGHITTVCLRSSVLCIHATKAVQGSLSKFAKRRRVSSCRGDRLEACWRPC